MTSPNNGREIRSEIRSETSPVFAPETRPEFAPETRPEFAPEASPESPPDRPLEPELAEPQPSLSSTVSSAGRLSRRGALRALSALGVGSLFFRRALATQVEQGQAVTPAMIEQAEWVAGLTLGEEERTATAAALSGTLRKFQQLRAVPLDNSIAPALRFHVDESTTELIGPVDPNGPADLNGRASFKGQGGVNGPNGLGAVTAAPSEPNRVRGTESAAAQRPAAEDDLAFLPVTELAALLRTRQVSSVELTQLYLKRLQTFDPALHCVVSRTEELALRQAELADRELASGRYRGPLHGIPWGAKDLIAYPGYNTTWGAAPFRDQRLDVKATVAERLDGAGAVLVAKLSLGALAWGDHWFGGITRNPWNPRQGSSGSSAGSASATAAGLVGFSLGSETLGSIVSPCRRCGTTGLRPTFGRVSRHGCMSLAWSMDKIGPICRSVEDCALVFSLLHGADGLDPTAVDRPFHWPASRSLKTLRVGYIPEDIPEDAAAAEERPELRVLRDLGVRLVPIQLPRTYPVDAMTLILNTEAAAVFDQLTRDNISEGLNRWPNAFREGQFVPAVEYLRANRIRSLLMKEMNQLMAPIDAYVGGNDLALTNLTGHPTVVLPGPLRTIDGVRRPSAYTFTGRLFGESELLTLAHAFQQATGHHLERPDLNRLLPAVEGPKQDE